MSLKNATEFLSGLDGVQLKDLAKMAGGTIAQKAADNGYPCTVADLQSAIKKQASAIGDDELDKVAGGQRGETWNSIRASCLEHLCGGGKTDGPLRSVSGPGVLKNPLSGGD